MRQVHRPLIGACASSHFTCRSKVTNACGWRVVTGAAAPYPPRCHELAKASLFLERKGVCACACVTNWQKQLYDQTRARVWDESMLRVGVSYIFVYAARVCVCDACSERWSERACIVERERESERERERKKEYVCVCAGARTSESWSET